MQKDLVNKQSYSELALLVIFASGLFFANLIVKSRSQIQLGEGYELPGAGLKVHWPAEKGWQGLTQWQLEQKNCLVLPARSNQPIIEVRWVYGFSTSAKSSEALLDQLAAEFGGAVIDKKLSAGTAGMQTGRLVNEKTPGDCYLGAAVLDFGRTLTLQVQSEGDLYYTYDVFTALAGSIEYTKPELLSAGAALIAEIQRGGAGNLLVDRPDQHLVILDTAGSVRGYESTQIKQNMPDGFRIDRTLVINTAAVRRKDYTFESRDLFGGFHWQNSFSNTDGQGSVFQINLKDNVLTVQDPTGQVQTISPSPIMVCEILLDALMPSLIASSQQAVVLDVLNSEGRIVPSRIQSIPPAQALSAPKGTQHAVRIESIGGVVNELYFDANKNLLEKIAAVNKGSMLIWKPTTRQDIERYFDTRPVRKGPVAIAKSL